MWNIEKTKLKTLTWDYSLVKDSYISTKNTHLFVLICLFKYNIINKETLLARANSIKKGNWDECKNNYKCKILKKWYNNINLQDLTLEYIKTFYNSNNNFLKISTEEFLLGLNLVLNRNRSYCVNHIIFNYVQPSLVYSLNKANFNHPFLLDLNIVDISKIKTLNSYFLNEEEKEEIKEELKKEYRLLNKEIVNYLLSFKNSNFQLYSVLEKDFTLQF